MFNEPFELVGPLLPPVEKITADLRRALERRRLSNDGPFVRRLEERMADLLGFSHVVATANATLGLILALRALDVKGEVICPSFTFAATPHAIHWAGCTPVLADIDPETWTIDPRSVDRLKGDATSAVIPVDIFGVLAQVPDAGLPVVVDAASAMGSRKATDAAAAVYSLHPTKALTAGEGGLVCVRDADLAGRLRKLRNYGFERGLDCGQIGLNAKMSEPAAILACHQIDLLDETIRRNEAWRAAYLDVLADVPGLKFQAVPDGVNPLNFAVRVDAARFGMSRDALAEALKERNIVTRTYFNPPVHRMKCYEGKLRSDDLPVTEAVASSVLCLPVQPAEPPEIAGRIGGLIRSLARPD